MISNKAIEVKNLSYSYPDGTPALECVELTVFEGETLGIIGPNGAGKSTFLLHLNGVLRGSGEVKIFGAKINGRNLSEIRRKVGLVFQEPDDQLFMPTVRDDVAFGPANMELSKDKIEEAVRGALVRVDMLRAIDRSAHHMSFGERKRVSIATVLSMNPEILVLDEPTSNLDPRHRRELAEFLKSLGHTKVIATHDLDIVKKLCSRVAIFDAGRIAAVGLTDEIVGNSSLLEKHGLV